MKYLYEVKTNRIFIDYSIAESFADAEKKIVESGDDIEVYEVKRIAVVHEDGQNHSGVKVYL